jgi:regulator of nonsense transcripts 1
MFDALFAFRDKYCDPTLVDLILGNSLENPEIPSFTENVGNVPGLEPLNPSQLNCVQAAISKTYSLIQGPPGTGKTQTLTAIVYHLLQNLHPDHKILVCSTSNAAIENIVKRIAQTGVSVLRICSKIREKIPSSVDEYCLHIKLKNYISTHHPSFLNDYISRAIYDEELSQELLQKYFEYTKDGTEQIILNSKVICCTNCVAGDSRLGDYYYDTVLVDEANQATEPEILVPLLNGCSRFILAGDQMQLGPVSMCKSSIYGGLSRSLFSRLTDLGAEFYVLDTQYRMHQSISRFPIQFFYEDRLKDGISSLARIDPNLRANFWPNNVPLVFIDHLNFEGNSGAGKSFVNTNEAFIILECVEILINEGIEASRQVILTPYDGQKRYIIDLMDKFGIDIEVYNIDEFQGKEKDYVLFSLVRSNEKGQIGFLGDFKRMNVGITRARYGMIIFGSSNLLVNSKLWRHLIKYYSENNLIFEGMFGRLRRVNVHVGELEVYNFTHVFPYAGSK